MADNNPKPEPVAWMYEQDGCFTQFRLLPLTDTHGAKWTETPLYPADALDEAYRRGQEDMRERAAVEVGKYSDCLKPAQAWRNDYIEAWEDGCTDTSLAVASAIRALEIKS